jgi:hypothetical protein
MLIIFNEKEEEFARLLTAIGIRKTIAMAPISDMLGNRGTNPSLFKGAPEGDNAQNDHRY